MGTRKKASFTRRGNPQLGAMSTNALSQEIRIDTGSAIRPKKSRQDPFWTLIHGQEGEGVLEASLRKKKVPMHGGRKLTRRIHFETAVVSMIFGSQIHFETTLVSFTVKGKEPAMLYFNIETTVVSK